MSAFMVVLINITNLNKFKEYFNATQKVATLFGAELVLRGKVSRVLTDDDSDHEMTVIVKFPSIEKLEQWYNSDEYQSLIPLRNKGSKQKITSYEMIASTVTN